jgi:superfamily II DNA or RNA helicase
MTSHFITNQNGNFLSEIIKSILPKAQNISFLAGYFYFSGFAEIYKGIKDKNLRVLVGLEIERDMINHVREVDYHTSAKKTRGELKASFNESLVDLFNETDYFDSAEKQEAFTFFLNKIKDGTLEIRKTKEPCHAKMYLFQNTEEYNEGGSYPGALITGSSNLSLSGLKGRLELNAILRGKADFEEGKKIFEQLWESAVIIADREHLAEFENVVLEKIWYDKLYKPYCFFLRVLDEYFCVRYDKDLKTAHEINPDFYELHYQSDAIRLALATIERHNGVIISDVVGLGKSIIGSVAAHNLRSRTLIVAPPHLVPQWEEYCVDFNYHAKVFSSGKTDAALSYFNEKSTPAKQWLIIIDEAHKYRNEYTADYNNLHKLCRGNKVMLLTATPFNNRPADIYSMVKLFQIPLKSTLKHIDNLSMRFNALILWDKKLRKKQLEKEIDETSLKQEIDSIAAEIRHIISPVVIRRSRLDLLKIDAYKKDLEKQNIGFAETGDPEAMEYDLGDIKDMYLSALRQISPDLDMDPETAEPHYLAARYNAVQYVKEQYKEKLKQKIEEAGIEYNLFIGMQRNLAQFMRRLLVQRFESSKKAFELSLVRMVSTSKNILNWIDKRGTVPLFKRGALPDIENYYRDAESDDSLFNEELADALFEEELHKFEAKGLFELEVEYFDAAFVEDIKSDVQILENIRQNWFGENKKRSDPKQEHFVEILRDQLAKEPKRKIVVFSSYADTVDDLYEKLKISGIRVFKYTSKNTSRTSKAIVERNFDAGKKMQDDDYDVLVATDAISEGYNLHRAGTIFNYDIPYNPTRVIQRVGRINRINKKVFDRLYIYNYFPTSIGESETRTKEISTHKMAMINAILGEDTKALTKDIELKSFFADEYNKTVKMSETESWDSKYRNLLDAAKGTKEYENALAVPHHARIGRTADKERKGILVFGRKKDLCMFRISKDLLDSETLGDEEAIKLFEASVFEDAKKVSASFDAVYQNVKRSLFANTAAETKTEKDKREVLDKIRDIERSAQLNIEYVNLLRDAAEIGALSGYTMQFIRRLAPKDYAALPAAVGGDFLERVQKMTRKADNGSESIILSEELQ